ncbi:PREDICTED: uncharacterized protein LOC104825432 [Tarenaya hassleriana]|uniref:uncharacterized protein LOC104825432 n=1 Tax=Tarenaya hassleriana TaxID=28532 RepID=UPI00053C79FB|nr:PREDICTED: uncharacterized protein LOC104825432 [Tarenaya hassleriana]
MTKSPFTGKGQRADELLSLIHSDVCGPMNTPARGGYSYFVTFTDDYSRYGYVYLMRSPSKSVQKTSYELWVGKSLKMSYLRIWGCDIYVKRQLSDKLGPKSERCLFVGYPKETRGYYFYNPTENKVFVARDRTFLNENSFPRKLVGVRLILEKSKSHKLKLDLAK